MSLIDKAASVGSELVFFPELSLTGYEPKLARRLAEPAQELVSQFQYLSNDKKIVIGVGLPDLSETDLFISTYWFFPDGECQIYRKQILHQDELGYFKAGDSHPVIKVGHHSLAPAICYESLQDEHAMRAAEFGAHVYMASVAKSVRGLQRAEEHYPNVARKHQMLVLMANAVGPSDDFIAAGTSSVWDENGRVLCSFGEKDEGIIVFNIHSKDVDSYLF